MFTKKEIDEFTQKELIEKLHSQFIGYIIKNAGRYYPTVDFDIKKNEAMHALARCAIKLKKGKIDCECVPYILSAITNAFITIGKKEFKEQRKLDYPSEKETFLIETASYEVKEPFVCEYEIDEVAHILSNFEKNVYTQIIDGKSISEIANKMHKTNRQITQCKQTIRRKIKKIN